MTSPLTNEERDGLVERFELDEGGFLGGSGKMVPDPYGDWVRFEDWLTQAAEITRLRAEVERKDAALKPFAKAGELFPGAVGTVEFDQCIYAPAAGPEYSLCGDHLRAARAARSPAE